MNVNLNTGNCNLKVKLVLEGEKGVTLNSKKKFDTLTNHHKLIYLKNRSSLKTLVKQLNMSTWSKKNTTIDSNSINYLYPPICIYKVKL